MRTKATVRLKFSSDKKLQTTLSSLKPEISNPATTRSQASLKKENRFLTLTIEAKDTVALRASLNAYLRWIYSILNVFETLDAQ